MNNAGEAVGFDDVTLQTYVLNTVSGAFTYLPDFAGGATGRARRINEEGVVAGAASDPNGTWIATTWAPPTTPHTPSVSPTNSKFGFTRLPGSCQTPSDGRYREVLMSVDARVARLERNIFSWRADFARLPGVTDHSEVDVAAISSAGAMPFLNVVMQARFDDWALRCVQVATPYVARRQPWIWWTTPSTTSAELEKALQRLGAVKPAGQVGMWCSLEPQDVTVDGADLAVFRPGEDRFVQAFFHAWGFPPGAAQDVWQARLALLDDQDAVAVVASVGGEDVAAGLGYGSGDAWGLWLIGTHSAARGRGIGTAITRTLINEGIRRGHSDGVLGATVDGKSIYERLGFHVVCEMAQWLWQPTA